MIEEAVKKKKYSIESSNDEVSIRNVSMSSSIISSSES